MVRKLIIHTYKQARRVVIVVVGFTIFIIGIIMIALPGPAILVIPLGLALLATEFVWARNLLHKFKATAERITNPHKARRLFTRIFIRVRQTVLQPFSRKRVEGKHTPSSSS